MMPDYKNHLRRKPPRRDEPVAPGAPITVGDLLDALGGLRDMTGEDRAEYLGLRKGTRVKIISR